MMKLMRSFTSKGPGPTPQKVVVVGSHRFRELVLQAVLKTNNHELIFVESMRHAYSQIKRVAPSIVVMCLEVDDQDAYLALSMLKFDRSTSHIPVVTCVTPDTAEPDAETQAWSRETPADFSVVTLH
jgi:PleD family two-component response regulator